MAQERLEADGPYQPTSAIRSVLGRRQLREVERARIPATMASALSIAHLIGMALAVGSATVKLVLLLRCRADPSLIGAYLRVAGAITRLIMAGMALLILSGIGWLLLGYPVTPLLMVKGVLVAAVLVLGPIIDKVFEPRFRNLAPQPGHAPSPAFIAAQRPYLVVEIVANLIFYVTIVIWALR